MIYRFEVYMCPRNSGWVSYYKNDTDLIMIEGEKDDKIDTRLRAFIKDYLKEDIMNTTILYSVFDYRLRGSTTLQGLQYSFEDELEDPFA